MKSVLPVVLFLASCQASPVSGDETDVPNDSSAGYASVSNARADKIEYGKYCNGRFGYCVEYPKAVMYPQPESENGDGRVFKNKNGDEVLRVFGRIPEDVDGAPISLEQQYDLDIQGGEEPEGSRFTLTYQKLGKDFFVLSGYSNGTVFYQKTIMKNGNFAYAILRYDEAQKEQFAAFSEKLFRSFK